MSWLPTLLLKVLTAVYLRTCQKPLLFAFADSGSSFKRLLRNHLLLKCCFSLIIKLSFCVSVNKQLVFYPLQDHTCCFFLAVNRLWNLHGALRAVKQASASPMAVEKSTMSWCSSSGGTAPSAPLPASRPPMRCCLLSPMAIFLLWAWMWRQRKEVAHREERHRAPVRYLWRSGGTSQPSLPSTRCAWSERSLKPTCWRLVWR